MQVLWGDIDTAIHIHDILYHVMERHNFLPEAFTHDFRVHWGNHGRKTPKWHPLRPESLRALTSTQGTQLCVCVCVGGVLIH